MYIYIYIYIYCEEYTISNSDFSYTYYLGFEAFKFCILTVELPE
jgi:hypothetical protein